MLEAAAAEVPASGALRTLLAAVRNVGNWLNMGTARGEAGAFKLEVLLQLAQVGGSPALQCCELRGLWQPSWSATCWLLSIAHVQSAHM